MPSPSERARGVRWSRIEAMSGLVDAYSSSGRRGLGFERRYTLRCSKYIGSRRTDKAINCLSVRSCPSHGIVPRPETVNSGFHASQRQRIPVSFYSGMLMSCKRVPSSVKSEACRETKRSRDTYRAAKTIATTVYARLVCHICASVHRKWHTSVTQHGNIQSV